MCSIFGYCGKVRDETAFEDGFSQTKSRGPDDSRVVKAGGGSVALMFIMIVGVSVLLSAFIDNIPYVATMLPVVTGISALLGIEPYLFDFGLLIGATLGGNITPIGASANITGIGILQKEGYKVSTRDFIRIGIPFTIVAAVTGALVIWLVWA